MNLITEIREHIDQLDLSGESEEKHYNQARELIIVFIKYLMQESGINLLELED